MAQVKFEVVVKKENDHFICEICDLANWNKLYCEFKPGLYWKYRELIFHNGYNIKPFRKLLELASQIRFQVRVKDLAEEMEAKGINQTVFWVFY